MGQSAEELRQDIEKTRDDLSGRLDAIGDRVSPGRMVERRRNRMKDSFSSTRDRVFGRADAWRSPPGSDESTGLGERVANVGSSLSGAPEAARHQTEGNPILAGLVAFGAGFAAAAVFPGSPTEGKAVQRLSEAAGPLKEEAAKAKEQLASTLQESGQQAAEQLKESATASAERVKGTAQSEVATTKDAATEAAEQVKAKGTSSS